MWFWIVALTVLGLLVAGYFWETRRKRALYQRPRSGAAYVEAGQAGSFSRHDIAYTDSAGDCGGGGGGGGDGGGGGC